jgi:phage baseplate assembly protein W
MAIEINKEFMGSGWAFPLKIDNRGGIALSRSEGGIDEAIRLILSTSRGERRMRPNFGCDVNTLIFSPNNATTWGLACHYVEDALAWWEPRIEVLKVEAIPDPADSSRLIINISYRVKATNDARNIVYPFYLMGRSE